MKAAREAAPKARVDAAALRAAPKARVDAAALRAVVPEPAAAVAPRKQRPPQPLQALAREAQFAHRHFQLAQPLQALAWV